MRAATYHRFGGPEVMMVEQLPDPVPAPGEIRIRVRASTVSAADYRARSRDLPRGLGLLGGAVFGFVRPKIPVLGMDFSGVVDDVGDGVTAFVPGQAVIGMLGSHYGGHGEYVCVPASGLIARGPDTMGFEQAVTLVFGGFTAMDFLDRAHIGAGDEILVNGASGACGTAFVQLATARGAVVTAVCSAGNAGLVTDLGAAHVIDYAREDFTGNGLRYDAIVDCVGNAPFERVVESIRPGGAYLPVITDLPGMLKSRSQARRSGRRVLSSTPTSSASALLAVVELAEAGRYRAVIDSEHDLDDIVAAHRRTASGHKVGSVVLRVG